MIRFFFWDRMFYNQWLDYFIHDKYDIEFDFWEYFLIGQIFIESHKNLFPREITLFRLIDWLPDSFLAILSKG